MWLLEQSVRLAMEQAHAAGILPNDDQKALFEASRISAGESRILTVAGDTARIAIEGVLTKTPDFLAMLFGGGNTTYSEIAAALAEAEADNNIAQIEFMFNSPGGNIDGLFETMDIVAACKKRKRAIVTGLAASAAYMLASQADEIIATNNASRVGSIGVLWSTRIDDKEIAITSTKAPKKAPDVTTEEGKAVVREELDALHDLFVGAIAKGRDVSDDKVNANFGQGAVVLAGEALKRGMIDSIAKTQLKAVDSAITETAAIGGEHKSKGESMDLNELKAKHPDVYNAAVQVGINEERERVNAHLHMGKETAAMTVAIEAIEKGDGFGPMVTAKYVSAGMARNDQAARSEDDATAAEALANAGEGGTGAKDATDEADFVAAAVETSLGVTAAI